MSQLFAQFRSKKVQKIQMTLEFKGKNPVHVQINKCRFLIKHLLDHSIAHYQIRRFLVLASVLKQASREVCEITSEN